MMVLKIFTFYFSVSLAQNIWIAVDVFITVLLTWAVSQSKPATKLADQRPTAQLLGPQILASAIGVVAINWLFLIGAFVLLYQQSWFRCNEFDANAVDVSKWWLLSDNVKWTQQKKNHHDSSHSHTLFFIYIVRSRNISICMCISIYQQCSRAKFWIQI
jgi:magnesium-transporting ATPase (P-type)